jgi:hypothetical protein
VLFDLSLHAASTTVVAIAARKIGNVGLMRMFTS